MAGVVRREMLSERVRAIKPSGIRKFFDIAATMPDVISLGVGEPDFVTPEHIRQAGIGAIDAGETHYTSNYGTLELRQAIATMLAAALRRHATIPRTEVMVTVGVSEGIDATLRAVLDEGDEVLVPDPGYVAYEADVTLAGGVVVPVRTHVEDEFEVQGGGHRGGADAALQGGPAGQPQQPDRRGHRARRTGEDRRARHAPRPAGHQRRGLQPAGLRRRARLHRRAARHARAHRAGRRLLEGLCDDGLARRLRLRAGASARSDPQGAPVRHHVRRRR